MIDERYLVAALLQDRAAYDLVAGRLDPADFGAQAQLVVKAASQFYAKDPQAARVDMEVLRSLVTRTLANPKHAQAVLAWLADLPPEVSAINVAAEYRALRRHRVGLELAGKLAGGESGDAVDRLIEKYRLLGVEGEGQADKPRLSLEELIGEAGTAGRIRLGPAELGRHTAPGAARGHHIVVFARPEAGKSMFAINLAAGFLGQGLKVLYTGNEEPIADLQRRFLARLSGIRLSRLATDADALRRAVEKAEGRGYGGLYAQELVTGRTAEVEALVRKYQPDVLVVDQLRNLKAPSGSGGNTAKDLDDIAKEVRRVAKANNCLLVSVTQAGDSAEGKLRLGMSDIEFSKTGIPGSADLMIGIGVNDQYHAANRRAVSLPKNKLSGKHSFFTLFVEPDFCLYSSKPRQQRQGG